MILIRFFFHFKAVFLTRNDNVFHHIGKHLFFQYFANAILVKTNCSGTPTHDCT